MQRIFSYLKKKFNLKKQSIFILCLPYFVYLLLYLKIYQSYYFNIYLYFLYLFFVIITDLLFTKILIKINISFITVILSSLITFTIILILYSAIVSLGIFEMIILLTGIRYKYLYILILIILTAARIVLKKFDEIFNLFINRTFIILTAILVLSKMIKLNNSKPNSIAHKPAILKTCNYHNNKPIILIVLDEYNSPDGLRAYCRDTNLYSFSQYLSDNGWEIKNDFFSHEIYTVYSISSLFNFNLSASNNYKNEAEVIAKNMLVKSRLIDSLSSKNIIVKNFSFFQIGNYRELKESMYYKFSNNFFGLFFDNTLLPLLTENHINKASSHYNSSVFTYLISFLNSNKTNKVFTYAHIYMPHWPIAYNNEIFLSQYDISSYYSYWKFTNMKIQSLLESTNYKNKYRIIITGDHGYRGDNNINPHSTFTAFYGFDSGDIAQIRSVQDLGTLINAYYKK